MVPVPRPGISRRIFYRIWATVKILLLAIVMVFIFQDYRTDWIVQSTGSQETKDVKLPDGSTVVLNANSELKWKRGIENKRERVVKFTGEAFLT